MSLSKEAMEEIRSRYYEGKMQGMYEVYEAFDDAVRKLRDSLDNVWMIHDQDDFATQANRDYKSKLGFAINTLNVVSEIFQDRYDIRMEKLVAERDGDTEEE